MSTLSQWNPFRDLLDWEQRLQRSLGFGPRPGGKESMTVSQWTPLVDITEDDAEYMLKVELPEMKKDEVKVSVENGELTLTGERQFEKEEKNKKYHRIERSYGSFVRSFTLPDNVDAAKVSAEFKDGLLRVHLPKQEPAKPAAVQVPVN